MKRIFFGKSQMMTFFVALFIFSSVFAAPPFGPYMPNETLDPNCAPGDTNCLVQLNFLTGELDPVFIISPAFTISTGNILNWNTVFGWGNHATQGYLTGSALNGYLTGSALNGYLTGGVLANYLTGFTELDPIFSSSPSFGIGTGNISNWNTSFGWGNHATQGYLTGTKISSLNSLTTDTQTFATGNTGTGFNISSAGSTHTFNIPFATGGVNGLLSSTNWTIFNNKIGLASLSASNPLTYNSGSGLFGINIANSTITGAITPTDWNIFNSKQNAMVQATTSSSGWLSSVDWNTFNNKLGNISIGVPANGLSLSGSTLSLELASTSTTGALSSTDWYIFNNKQNTLSAGAGIDITGNTISTNGWQLGGNSAGGSFLGSTNSFLPFMSNGNVMMQLNDSNLSLSFNQSFIDNTGNNGLFIGNHNSYGGSSNVLAVGESLDIRDGNKNMMIMGQYVDHIERNEDSFFGGTSLSSITKNINTFSFGTKNEINENTSSVLFGENNTWSSEISKFIVGNNNKKWFQVDMENGETLFDGQSGNAGEYLMSQGAGAAPAWQTLPTSTGNITGATNGLTFSSGDVGLGGVLDNNTTLLHDGKTFTFALSSINTQNAINMLANTLTSGTILNIDSSYNLLNSTNGLFRVANTSSSTNGFLARFQANASVDSGLSILTSGNIGIGDSSPASLLTVGSGDLFQVNTSGFALAPGGTAANPSYTFVGDADTGMYHPANNSLRFSAGGNTIGRMDTTGWMLGDGSTAPVSLVHIGGGINPATFRMTNNTSGNTVTDGFFINYSTGSVVSLSNLENADMIIGTNNLERMRILSGGNIGIGTTTPSSTLSVAGSLTLPIRTVAISTTLTATDYTVINTAATTITFTLPAANTGTGRLYSLVNNATVASTVSSYQNLSNTAVTAIGSGSTIMLQSDGSNWRQVR